MCENTGCSEFTISEIRSVRSLGNKFLEFEHRLAEVEAGISIVKKLSERIAAHERVLVQEVL